MLIKPKNWTTFQHYTDRLPPWIKLHRSLLDNRTFVSLPLASKALAPFLWLIASEHKDGLIEMTEEDLCWRLRMTQKELNSGLAPLIEHDFFEVVRVDSNSSQSLEHDASTPIATCASEERRGETETKAERETDSRAKARARGEEFEQFWEVYPRKIAKQAALRAFESVRKAGAEFTVIVAGARAYRSQREGQDPQYTAHPATWLNAARWADEAIPTKGTGSLGIDLAERDRLEALEREHRQRMEALRDTAH